MQEYNVLRESALNWYEFNESASALEIVLGTNSIAPLLLRRVKKLCIYLVDGKKESCLDILMQTLTKEQLDRITWIDRETLSKQADIYDYIVCLQAMEYEQMPKEALKLYMRSLKPGGHFLLGMDNRYGLRYFCGHEDIHTGLPFSGINNYMFEETKEATGRGFSRREIETLILDAAKENKENWAHQFYYPVPDIRMPQMIFSDRYQKGINATERLMDYNYESATMLGVSHRILGELIDDGALPFMANSFLVELFKNNREYDKAEYCEKTDIWEGLSDIIYAVVTTDRGPFYGMATTIRDTLRDDISRYVVKRPLWKDGEKNIRMLQSYTEELIQKGIPMVKTSLLSDSKGCYLTMPFVEQEGLTHVLERMVQNDKEQFVEIFDTIYENIKKSADGQTGRVFIDLAPCNAFFVPEIPGRVLFYDQEFVHEHASAQFAMYRTIKYFFASSKVAREQFFEENLWKRYGFSENEMEEFEKLEQAFITSLRNTDSFAWLYKQATPNYDLIYENIKKNVREQKPYRVGYVPGVYDLFHAGHLRLFERCKERCDYLIVGVLTDELVEYYKNKRPVISYENRARVIEGLSVVDKVIPVDFSNTDKLDAWEQLHYDCHFSGDDHVGHWNDVMEELKKRGSNMEFFSYTEGISSTAIKNKMRS